MDLRLIQRDAAVKIGSDTTSIANWEMGRREPEIRFLPAILGFLGYDPRPQPKTTGEKLIAYRLARGWARPRLAAELDVDPSTLARWETGKREPWGVYVERVDRLLASVP